MNLEGLIQECTVQIITKAGKGTGSIIAPGLILTCNHVLGGEIKAEIRWKDNKDLFKAEVLHMLPIVDVAVLQFIAPPSANQPCIYLDNEIRVGNQLHFFGYPDKDYPNGCPVTIDCEGLTGDKPQLIKFKAGQIRSGMSGSALLNMNTGKVCGIVKATREASFDLGGNGILASTILKELPQIASRQKDFHGSDKRWEDALLRKNGQETNTLNNETRTISFKGRAGESTIEAEETHSRNKGGKILLLSTHSEDIESKQRRKELRVIREALDNAKYGELFHVESRPELEIRQLPEALQAVNPRLIDVEVSQEGLDDWVNRNILKQRPSHTNPASVVAKTLRIHSEQLQCVILNGNHSQEQASDITMSSDFLISIKNELTREELLGFYKAFYRMLGQGREFKACFESGVNSLELKSVNEAAYPVFLSMLGEKKRRALRKRLTKAEQAISKQENKATLWEEKASTLRALDLYSQADQSYKVALSIEPNNYKIKAEQADALEEAGEHKEAIALYEEAIRSEGKDYKIWWKKGQALANAEKYGEATEAFKIALDLNPPYSDNYVIYREYAASLCKTGDREKGVKMYKQSLNIESRYRVSSYEKRKMYREMYARQGYI